MIPSYLSDLQLDAVFAAYTSHIDSYLQQTNKSEYVVDSESAKVSGFVSSSFGRDEYDADKYFFVNNLKHKVFSLLQIDNATISTHTTSKCDCAILNDSFFSFIEFKANAISTKKNTVKSNYKKAIKQLRVTQDIVRNGLAAQGKDFLTMRDVEAYVCFRKGYPRFTNSEAQYRVKFAEDTGIPLSFDPAKII